MQHEPGPVGQKADVRKRVEPFKLGDNAIVSEVSELDNERAPRARGCHYIDWATLLARIFGVDPLVCPKCQGKMKVIAVISKREIVDKILAHVRLPVDPVALADGRTLGFDVTGEPIPDWVVGTDPQTQHPEAQHSGPQEYERGPPMDFDVVDPPCPDG